MSIVRRLLLAMALAVGTTLFIPAGPAHAGELRVCFQVGVIGGRPIFECFTIMVPDLAPQPPGPPECLSCPATWVFWNDLDPLHRFDFVKDLGAGLQFLGQAELSKDPIEIKKLLGYAGSAFRSSAELLSGAEAKLDDVGWADLKNSKFHPDPTGNQDLKAAGENLVAGLALMQEALGDPEPQPNLEAAMARFGQAYDDIAALYGGG